MIETLKDDDLIPFHREIIDQAIKDYKPKAIVLLLSGGDDSLAAYIMTRLVGIKIDYVLHGNTRTGIEETTEFVYKTTENFKDKFLLADAGSSYTDYVMRKGFFGVGDHAHSFSYNILKRNHFNRVISRYLRKGRRNFPILLINGARRNESTRRQRTMKNPIKIDPRNKNNIWVNIINEFSKKQTLDLIVGNGLCRNPVSINLCRSGECMCGTMQSEGEYLEAKYFYPEWGGQMDQLRKVVSEKHGWDWGENLDNHKHMEMKGQLNMFQPMCTSCTIKNEKT